MRSLSEPERQRLSVLQELLATASSSSAAVGDDSSERVLTDAAFTRVGSGERYPAIALGSRRSADRSTMAAVYRKNLSLWKSRQSENESGTSGSAGEGTGASTRNTRVSQPHDGLPHLEAVNRAGAMAKALHWMALRSLFG